VNKQKTMEIGKHERARGGMDKK